MNRFNIPWVELIEGQWKTTFLASQDKMETSMFIKIGQPALLQYVIPQILGSHSVINAPGIGPSLSRLIPAKHPRFPWMFATDMSLEGQGKIYAKYDKMADNAGLPNGPGLLGTWGDMDHWIIRIKFEALPYVVLPDPVNAEYQRWTEWEPLKPTVETLARRGRTWYFTHSNPAAAVTSPPGDTLLRVPKAKLTLWWRNVPTNYVLKGGVFPPNIINGIGKVNSESFPKWSPQGDVNANASFQFRPGTLLMLAPEFILKNNVPAFLAQNGDPLLTQFYNKVCDVKFEFLYFDPPSQDPTQVRLPTGDNILVRGHNLFPTPFPISGNPIGGVIGSWWAASTSSGGSGVLVGAIPGSAIVLLSDNYLLYQYYDFEQLFEYGGA